MIIHPVIFILLCWQFTGGKSLEDLSLETLLDQVAIPTKIINEFFHRPENTPPIKKSIRNERVERSTVHYENSNGFVPLVVSTQRYDSQDKQNSTQYPDKKLNETKIKTQVKTENENLSSREARILVNVSSANENRRSFNTRGNQDDFELLKVSNGTPVVANYDTYYDQSKENSKPIHTRNNENSKKVFRNKDRDRGKKVQSYLASYDAYNEDDQTYHSTNDQKKTTYQHDRSRDYYKPNTAENYNQKPTLPRTNFAALSTQKSTFRQTSKPETSENKFKTPIIIQPSDYKVDIKINEQSVQTSVSTSNPRTDTKEQADLVYPDYESPDQISQTAGTNRNYDSADARDFSEEYDDYVDEKEKARRLQKTKRRPHYFDSSRKLPKEHRESYDNLYDDNGRLRTTSKPKSRYRQKSKPVRVVTEYQYNSEVEDSENNSNDNNNQNEGNNWNQVTPNVEVSHSNGFEVNQIEKPKLHIVPVNIVPTFDHATALDNSQGFDITNAMLTGFVDGSLVSTAAPLVSSSPNYGDENLMSSSTIQPKIELSTPVPDVIVGSSSFNNPVHAVLMPNKLQQNLLNQYLHSTISPAVYAVSPQSSFSASPSITPQLQQMLNQMQVFPINQQFMTAQSTNQPAANLLKPASQSSYSSNENLDNNLSSSSSSSSSTSSRKQNSYQPTYQSTSRSTTERTDAYYRKRTKGHNNGQYLASASMSVDHGSHRTNNRNKKKNNNHNEDVNYNDENTQQSTNQNYNSYVQPTVVPAIIHTGVGLINNQNQPFMQNPFIIANPQQTSQLFKATNEALENSIKQLQFNLLTNRHQLNSMAGLDTVGGASNSINNIANPVQKAQLPILGTKNVEIINPNLNANAYAINQIPAAIVTTPIPIFTTTGYITSKSTTTQGAPVSVTNFINALTEIGTKKPDSKKKKKNNNQFLNLQGSDGQLYNPINFVPNYDLVKSQSILNSNILSNDQFSPQNLNLVPLVPGGNFYKHSQGAQVDLANKPKLSSDLEKYAEEMFKESLRTIYNSHKWNNDPRTPSTNNISLVDNSDLAKLRNELLRIKSTLRDSKLPKDVLEAHHTENKIRAVKPGNGKRPNTSIEQSSKNKHHSHHHHPPHHHHHRPKTQLNDFLTPPKVNSFVSKSPFHDKPPKKRPPHGPRPNFNHENSRPRPRQGVASPNPKGLDAQASASVDYRYPGQALPDKSYYGPPDFRPSQSFNNYPTFTTSFPELDSYKSGEIKFSDRGIHDINHQRTHNLMGFLMKNHQLPPGVQSRQFTEKQIIDKIFDEENRRTQSQAYEDIMRSFHKKSDRIVQPIPLSRVVNTPPLKANR